MPGRSMVEFGNAKPSLEQLKRLIRVTAESAECLGGQLGRHDDRIAALIAALFLDHLWDTQRHVLQQDLGWLQKIPRDLGNMLLRWLDEGRPCSTYRYTNFDPIMDALKGLPDVQRMLAAAR